MRSVEENKKLIEKYPFLMPRNVWTDELLKDYDYSFTLYDEMPKGWADAFGMQMLEEIRALLIKGSFLDRYRITQIKEKYGSLRWYDTGVPTAIHDEFYACLRKYNDLSSRTCIDCGKPATKMSEGYICPYCDDCAKRLEDRFYSFVDIEDFFNDQI